MFLKLKRVPSLCTQVIGGAIRSAIPLPLAHSLPSYDTLSLESYLLTARDIEAENPELCPFPSITSALWYTH